MTTPVSKTTAAAGRADRSGGTAKAFAVDLMAALVAVYALFGPYLANLSDIYTRYRRHWRLSDSLLLVAVMFLTALAWVLAVRLAAELKRPLLVRGLEHLLVVALGAGVLANVTFYSPSIMTNGRGVQTAWLLMIGVAGYSLARPELKLVTRCRQLGQILFPAVVVLTIGHVGLSTYPSPHDPLPIATTAQAGHDRPRVPAPDSAVQDTSGDTPIYLFVFDEWSYDRTFAHGSPNPRMVNLSELAQHATVFHDAHSPAANTITSMPRLLFQTNLAVACPRSPGARYESHEAFLRSGHVGFERDGGFIEPAEIPSIFTAVGDRPYHTALVGVCLPYGAWLKGIVNVCRTYNWLDTGDGPSARMSAHLFSAMQYWTDPWFPAMYARLHQGVESRRVIEIHRSVKRDVLYFLERTPRNTFAVFHVMLPHYPYLFHENGALMDASAAGVGWRKDDTDGYRRNLAALDAWLGEFVDAMKRRGTFKDALILLTSDHSWRFDPARTSGDVQMPVTHVPLVVKFPRQRCPLSVVSTYETVHLRPIIAAALQGTAAAADIVKSLGLHTGPVHGPITRAASMERPATGASGGAGFKSTSLGADAGNAVAAAQP